MKPNARSVWAMRLAATGLFAIAVLSNVVMMPSPVIAQSERSPYPLQKRDLVTADGSLRIGQRDDIIFGVLTAIETRVILKPDSWDSDAEARSWTDWLTTFDDNLYVNWVNGATVNAQETVGISIVNGAVTITNGTFLRKDSSPAPDAQATFESNIRQALEKTIAMAPPVPKTKSALQQVRMNLTFMRDPSMVPRFAPYELGFYAVRGADGNLEVNERTLNGRFPGIQILSKKGGGNINQMDLAEFKQKSAAASAL